MELKGEEYLKKLKENLDFLIDKLSPNLIFYISGVDILDTDKLGRLAVKEKIAKKEMKWFLNFLKSVKLQLLQLWEEVILKKYMIL